MALQENRNEAVKSHAEDISVNQAPSREEIRLRAYEIHLERGGFPGHELDDWLLAEFELQHAAPPKAQKFPVTGRTE